MVLLAIVMTVIYWKRKAIFRLLSDKTDKSALFIVAYFYLSIELFTSLASVKEDRKAIIAGLLIILALQSGFILLAFYLNNSINRKMLKHEKQKQLQTHLKDIEDYAAYLESSEDELRKFKHDIRNLLASVDMKQSKDMEQLSEYIEDYIKDNTFARYKDLNHIEVKPLKNLFLTKIAAMLSQKIIIALNVRKK